MGKLYSATTEAHTCKLIRANSHLDLLPANFCLDLVPANSRLDLLLLVKVIRTPKYTEAVKMVKKRINGFG